MSKPMTDAELAELLRLAEAAPPEWEWESHHNGKPYNLQVPGAILSPLLPDQTWESRGHPHVLLKTLHGWEPSEAVAAFIGAAKPGTVKALVAELIRRRAEEAQAAAWTAADAAERRIAAASPAALFNLLHGD